MTEKSIILTISRVLAGLFSVVIIFSLIFAIFYSLIAFVAFLEWTSQWYSVQRTQNFQVVSIKIIHGSALNGFSRGPSKGARYKGSLIRFQFTYIFNGSTYMAENGVNNIPEDLNFLGKILGSGTSRPLYQKAYINPSDPADIVLRRTGPPFVLLWPSLRPLFIAVLLAYLSFTLFKVVDKPLGGAHLKEPDKFE